MKPDLPANHPFYSWKQQTLRDLYQGGDQPPCPFCGIPRVRRSDHIRCCRCATNWSDGEDITKDPRNERTKKFLADKAATSKQKPEG